MVTIKGQFNGPANSANGGYASGLLAREHATAPGPVQVRLHQPPPLDTPLTFEHDAEETRLLTAGGAVVGSARAGSFTHDRPAFATAEEAARGAAGYRGHEIHPFNTCFSCGPARESGDGLQIFSGPIGEGRVAAAWQVHEAFAEPDGTVDIPITWAAIDCPGVWTFGFGPERLVLGTMTAEVLRAPRGGETYHCVGEAIGQDGRKRFTKTALFTTDGELIARSEQVWIHVGT